MTTTKRVNSRQKGKRIELKAVHFLRSLGYSADTKRGQQHRGGDDSPDIICPDLPGIHFEVKGDRSIGLGTKALDEAYRQAHADADDDQVPVVLWWQHRAGWRLTWWTVPVPDTLVTAIPTRELLDRMNG